MIMMFWAVGWGGVSVPQCAGSELYCEPTRAGLPQLHRRPWSTICVGDRNLRFLGQQNVATEKRTFRPKTRCEKRTFRPKTRCEKHNGSTVYVEAVRKWGAGTAVKIDRRGSEPAQMTAQLSLKMGGCGRPTWCGNGSPVGCHSSARR